MSSQSERSPVFIIGGSRTGSEMLKTMLSASPDLDFVDEMRFLMPAWLHRDLVRTINSEFGSIAQVSSADALADLLYSGKPTGWFWSEAETQLDREMLVSELGSPPFNLVGLFRSIMVVHARMRNKNGLGAKFPVHYSFAEQLAEWFPGCRFIHTTRHPKAVYFSQARKHEKTRQNRAGKTWSRLQQFAHISIQTRGTAQLHAKLGESPNYRLIRYEDIIRAPEATISSLCEFLGVDFLPGMLLPNQYGSSFNEIGDARGIDASSLDKWRTQMSAFESRLFDGFSGRSVERLGYGDSHAEPGAKE